MTATPTLSVPEQTLLFHVGDPDNCRAFLTDCTKEQETHFKSTRRELLENLFTISASSGAKYVLPPVEGLLKSRLETSIKEHNSESGEEVPWNIKVESSPTPLIQLPSKESTWVLCSPHNTYFGDNGSSCQRTP